MLHALVFGTVIKYSTMGNNITVFLGTECYLSIGNEHIKYYNNDGNIVDNKSRRRSLGKKYKYMC